MPSKLKVFATTIILLIIAFTAIDYFLMYQAAQKLKADKVEVLGITPVKLPYEWKITFLVYIENPSDYIFEVKKITYKVYINGTYIGEDFKKYIIIPAKSRSDQTLTFQFDVRDIGEAAIIILSSDHIEVMVKGTIEVPVKLLRTLTISTVSLPYTYTEIVERS
ncbi:hypothetical protein DRO02_04835 [archaeon]|nr:MAG: hypothetical protein DRO02_04835 [archaeon]RLG64959.1 MAG: hypothetical protein DRO21_02975 [archaeon]HDM23672.1 hypothetical protein [Candidatus Bathyarchaeota archaeon]